jgi:hypothetical protein
LQHIDEILENTSGLVLSRTFGIKCNLNFNITRLTKCLITQCKEYMKPIYTFVDVNSDFDRRKRGILNDVMCNVIEGIDGFFIGIESLQNHKENQLQFEIRTLNYFGDLLKHIKEERNLKNLSMRNLRK